MPYHGPDSGRIARQFSDYHLTHAGQTATWRQYISASAGVAVAGFDATPFYREQTISGLFRPGSRSGQREQQTPIGSIDVGRMIAITPEPLARLDELLWDGSLWRVEGDSVSVPISHQWVTPLRKGL